MADSHGHKKNSASVEIEDPIEQALNAAITMTTAIGTCVMNDEFTRSSEIMLNRERLLQETVDSQEFRATKTHHALWQALEQENAQLMEILHDKQARVSARLKRVYQEKAIAAYKH